MGTLPFALARGDELDPGLAIVEPLASEPCVGAPTLDQFKALSELDDPSPTRGPDGQPADGPGIVADGGGAGAMYYCHAGKWFVYGYH